MYSRILVGIDGSDPAGRALTHAIGLAKAQQAALRIAHVVDMGWLSLTPELGIDTEAAAVARRDSGERLLAAAVGQARAEGVAAEPRLLQTGAPAQRVGTALVEEAASWPAALVVVGSRGRGPTERLVLGSVAEGVSRGAAIPVLLVH